MKIDTSNVKKGTILNVDGKLLKVLDIGHTHTGRWSATYSFKVKDIVNGGNVLLTYKSGTTLEQAEVNTQSAVYLYNAGDTYSFMENDTSEMHELEADLIEAEIPYLKENLDVYLTIHNGEVLGIILPNVVTYKVVETVPWVKGDRAVGGKKPATLESWLEVQVPLHINEWDEIRVNTITGEAG